MLDEMEWIVRQYVATKPGKRLLQVVTTGTDCWTVECSFLLNQDEKFVIRTVAEHDLRLLKTFGECLGPVSKDNFCPYPWGNEAQLEQALENAIRQSLQRVDLTFLMLHNGLPVGHFFLWKAGGNPHSKAYGVQIPELGIAIADMYQHKGLGVLGVRILELMARTLGADAIELTTALSNSAGWNTYIKTGFEYIANIRTPLEVDVTSAALGLVQAIKYRDERQMVYIIKPSQRDQVMEYLAIKRAQST